MIPFTDFLGCGKTTTNYPLYFFASELAGDYLTHIITFVRNTCVTQAGVRYTANG